MSRAATIKDIAERVGVGNSTVSAVLGRSPSRHVRVSEATRARVLEAAHLMHYRPNGVARALRSQKTDVLGVYTTPGYLNPDVVFSSQIIGGLHRGCYENDKDLLLHGIHQNRPAGEIYAELADGRIDGLVLYAFPGDPVLERLVDSSFPVVALVDAVAGLPSVVADDAGGSRLLAERLARSGHRHVLYVAGDPLLVSATRRLRGFQAAAGDLGIAVTEMHPSTHHEWLADADLGWLDRPRSERPTAAVCWNDLTAYHLLEECRERGLRVPEDLAVAGFDGLPSHSVNRQLTTIRAPWVGVARAAIPLLLRRIEGLEVPAETVLPVELIAGDTA